MQPRTKRQKDVLDYITRYITRNGHEPSYQQIARQLGVSSKAGIAKHVKSLEEQGLISRRRENGSFSLQLQSVNSIAESVCQIQWLNGPKREETEPWEAAAVSIPRFLIGSREPDDICAYRVVDDSMIEKHICEGDVVLVEKQPYARAGDVVVAIVNEESVVLHQFFRDGSNTELRPANPDYHSIILPADKIELKGIVRSMVRPFIYQER